MKNHIKKLNILLALALLLTGCTAPGAPAEPVAEDEPAPVEEDEPAPEKDTGYHLADTLFTINYDPASTLSPIYGTNNFNCDMMSLMYEGLYRLGPDFAPERVLCESEETEDGVTWFFHIKRGVVFHDGTELTANDVVDTVNSAAGGSKYSTRYSKVLAINAADDYTVSVVLSSANYDFPRLMDLPIVKSGTQRATPPTGTGPYVFTEDGYLEAFPLHRDYKSLPTDRVYYTSNDLGSLTRAFASKEIDLLNRDTTGVVGLNFHGFFETRYYDTTNLVYIGFNERRGAGSDPLVRKAIAKIFDRDSIVSEVYGPAVRNAPLVLSSALGEYDSAWEAGTGYDPRGFYDVISTAIVYDWDNDGYWDNSAVAASLDITLIVNDDNDHKVAVAKNLAYALEANGLRTELQILPYNQYVRALESGDFSLYVGEVKLTPDFDLTSLLTYGGRMNYGNISDPEYKALIAAYLGSEGEEKKENARLLCAHAAEKVDIIPVCYKKYAVLTHIGEVTNLSPSVSGVFTDIKNWKIDLGGREND